MPEKQSYPCQKNIFESFLKPLIKVLLCPIIVGLIVMNRVRKLPQPFLSRLNSRMAKGHHFKNLEMGRDRQQGFRTAVHFWISECRYPHGCKSQACSSYLHAYKRSAQRHRAGKFPPIVIFFLRLFLKVFRNS